MAGDGFIVGARIFLPAIVGEAGMVEAPGANLKTNQEAAFSKEVELEKESTYEKVAFSEEVELKKE